jgi:hypothetical protein
MRLLTTDETHDLANTIDVCLFLVILGMSGTYLAGIYWILK